MTAFINLFSKWDATINYIAIIAYNIPAIQLSDSVSPATSHDNCFCITLSPVKVDVSANERSVVRRRRVRRLPLHDRYGAVLDMFYSF